MRATMIPLALAALAALTVGQIQAHSLSTVDVYRSVVITPDLQIRYDSPSDLETDTQAGSIAAPGNDPINAAAFEWRGDYYVVNKLNGLFRYDTPTDLANDNRISTQIFAWNTNFELDWFGFQDKIYRVFDSFGSVRLHGYNTIADALANNFFYDAVTPHDAGGNYGWYSDNVDIYRVVQVGAQVWQVGYDNPADIAANNPLFEHQNINAGAAVDTRQYFGAIETPEPSTFALGGIGMFGAGLFALRRRRKAKSPSQNHHSQSGKLRENGSLAR